MKDWDLHSSCIIITTPWLMSLGQWQFLPQALTFHSEFDSVWSHARISQQLSPPNLLLYVYWIDVERQDWNTGSKMITTTCLGSWVGLKLAWPVFHFWHRDWVTLDWFWQFTASHFFQCLNVSIMNGHARLRFDFIMYEHHSTTAFDSPVVTISAQGPYNSHQGGVFLDWFKNFTAASPFQQFISSIMNVWIRMRLVPGL